MVMGDYNQCVPIWSAWCSKRRATMMAFSSSKKNWVHLLEQAWFFINARIKLTRCCSPWLNVNAFWSALFSKPNFINQSMHSDSFCLACEKYWKYIRFSNTVNEWIKTDFWSATPIFFPAKRHPFQIVTILWSQCHQSKFFLFWFD